MFLRPPTLRWDFSRKLHKLKSQWQSVVGLEIHTQISARSKLFSGSATEFGLPVNSAVSFFDASTPGTLPVLNRECVASGMKTALALNCLVNPVSMFDRKHYFYADMPNGYQITQQRQPLAKDGRLDLLILGPNTKKPYRKSVRLIQLQLEQDSGKSLHDEYAGQSLVDLNRAGVPLMELVFAPDLSDGEEAAALVKELILILTRLGTCSCRMEEGALRVDANVSVNREGEELGTRTEIKNIGSVRAVANAISHEIQRQIRVKEEGGQIHNETRAWNANTRETVSMRDKEVLQDYRFMPEPNLPPLHVNTNEEELRTDMINVSDVRMAIPELPEETRQKLCEQFGLALEAAVVLVNEPVLLHLFNSALSLAPTMNTKKLANVLINDLIAVLNKSKQDIEHCSVPAADVVTLVQLLEEEVLNNHLLHLVLEHMIAGPDKQHRRPLEIISEHNLRQITDEKQIAEICRKVIEENPKLVQQFKSGKQKVFKALVGEVHRLSEQKANMRLAVEKLQEMLK